MIIHIYAKVSLYKKKSINSFKPKRYFASFYQDFGINMQ
ncbi:hypothetical protein THERMOS_1029 [Bathymodiolus thermophilus thioautotrophic gill symbiont]|uniref:Uncharacterized protein n=1 Tax=Bathymodiolus thermophilus thioautotrophic gill symbiont TaxID=2360 RepID=A0A8H8XC20_9GAMM|nr:hypothetical protein THERMOS_1029 [Bathymodiolus thermophilus thioautotrophic gill symbiont]